MSNATNQSPIGPPSALSRRGMRIDVRGTLDTETWREAGWTVRSLGRP